MTERHWLLTGALIAAAALGGCAGEAVPPAPPAATVCLPWVDFPSDVHSNAESPFLGCDNRMNLRAEVDRPADLAAGRPLGPDDGERASLGVAAYQQGKIKPFGQGESVSPTIVLPNAAGGSQ